MNDAASNLPEFSVSDLSGALKRTIEDAFGFVRVRGEISGYRGPHSSGHVYFALKDQNAKIDAVIWKGSFNKLKFRPEEGLEVVATGRITTFPGKSSYQIIIEQMEPAGVGALMALLEERRRLLTAEGLFADARKRRLPYLPGVIGIITSPTGAVIRDMIHRLSDRFPRRVILWPVRVQGEGSAEEVAAAIRGFSAADFSLPRPDVLVVARGGGSLEDLWSFNEEIVVRAAAASRIPLVSAIGHETDWTLLDLAADIRAPTPTAAAEMVVPVRAELLASLADRHARLAGSVLRLAERRRRDFQSLARALSSGEALLAGPRQRLDLAGLKLGASLPKGIAARRLALSTLARRLAAQAPAARLATMRERLRQTEKRLTTAFSVAITLAKRDAERRRERLLALISRLGPAFVAQHHRRRARLEAATGMLGALGYRQVLKRGYAVVRDDQGKPVTRADMLSDGQGLALEFADGARRAVATSEAAPQTEKLAKTAPSKPSRSPRGAADQGSLF